MSNSVRAASDAREAALVAFLQKAGWGAGARAHLSGDASHRRYERVKMDGRVAVLMDDPSDPLDKPLGEGQRAYGEIAHLASGHRPFVAIGNRLRAEGLSAPEVFECDFDQGFLLLEDLGDALFKPLIDEADDSAAMEAMLYGLATDVLVYHHGQEQSARLPLPDGTVYEVPRYDEAALQIEADLLLDWYAPTMLDKTLDETARADFRSIWSALFPLATGDEVLILRDWHSPNLLLLDGRQGLGRLGIIDYQDGLMGHPAYDLMSMLQDARRDVPASLEAELVGRYLSARPDVDAEAFRAAYAMLGAQRASKIIGIFCRLWKRDGKDNYLIHLPRMWIYLERNLGHPALTAYKTWVDEHFPVGKRDR